MRRPWSQIVACFFYAFLLLFACSPIASSNRIRRFFDGKTLHGWMTVEGKPVGDSWEVIDGAIHRKSGTQSRSGDIVTEKEYGDFNLRFAWKIAPKGNSGIKYRVRLHGNSMLGLEYQLIDDDAFKDTIRPNTSTGALYDLYEPISNKLVKPAGEFNHSRIVVKGTHIEHWLNGTKIVDAEVGSEEWKARLAKSKFSKYVGFGENTTGRILLQDYGNEVWFRDFRMKR